MTIEAAEIISTAASGTTVGNKTGRVANRVAGARMAGTGEMVVMVVMAVMAVTVVTVKTAGSRTVTNGSGTANLAAMVVMSAMATEMMQAMVIMVTIMVETAVKAEMPAMVATEEMQGMIARRSFSLIHF